MFLFIDGTSALFPGAILKQNHQQKAQKNEKRKLGKEQKQEGMALLEMCMPGKPNFLSLHVSMSALLSTDSAVTDKF